MRAMGLDVGTKTVGVAVSDELGMTAQALTTLRRTNGRADLEALAGLAAERGATHLVVGLPRNMDGSEGPSAALARSLGDRLAERTGLPVTYWDERLTTREAQRALLEADVSRARRRKVIDQVAAALILQGWLDAQAGARAGEDGPEQGDWSDS
ncbi:MAG TPA: Holliday junction resolvase RuvX [Myxococcales bacterium]|nr:Holliday junction resolvase RuvX [Myxococcales bacterium]